MKRKHLLVDSSCFDGNRATLAGSDHHHVARVLRLREGAALSLSDGSGHIHHGRILAIRKTHVEIAIEQSVALPAPTPPRLSLIVALARGSRTEWTLQKCTELGADEIVPAICERSVVRPHDGRQKVERWTEILRQAARQSERMRLPALAPPSPLLAALDAAARTPGLRLIASPDSRDSIATLEKQLRATTTCVTMAVGPEGGFSAGEVNAATQRGFNAISLGPAILRAETAAVALLSIVGHLTGRLADSSPVV